MKIKDVEKGMKLKCVSDNPKGSSLMGELKIKKGDILTVKEVQDNLHSIKSEKIITFEEVSYIWWAKDFEPINKFKIGDKVLFTNFHKKLKAIIWGKRFNQKRKEYEYAIKDLKNDCSLLMSEHELSPLKKRKDLTKGDKFITLNNEKVEVIAKESNDFNILYYFVKSENGNLILIPYYDVKEIICD